MSGPFVLKKGYPWETILKIPIFVTEGTNTSSVESSRRLRDWMRAQKGQIAFKEVAADHPGMVPLVLPGVFAFFDSISALPVSLNPARRTQSGPARPGGAQWYFDLRGRLVFKPTASREEVPEEWKSAHNGKPW